MAGGLRLPKVDYNYDPLRDDEYCPDDALQRASGRVEDMQGATYGLYVDALKHAAPDDVRAAIRAACTEAS